MYISSDYSNRDICFKSRIGTPINMNKTVVGKIMNGGINEHFVPTPECVTKKMVRALGKVSSKDRVLEPSAGYGHIADCLVGTTPLKSEQVDVIEPIPDLRKILAEKGYSIVGKDIMKYNPSFKYDKIVMNPPFDNGNDILHVLHCFQLLKPKGTLVAILPENDFLKKGQNGCEKWIKDWLGNGEKREINEYLSDLLILMMWQPVW